MQSDNAEVIKPILQRLMGWPLSKTVRVLVCGDGICSERNRAKNQENSIWWLKNFFGDECCDAVQFSFSQTDAAQRLEEANMFVMLGGAPKDLGALAAKHANQIESLRLFVHAGRITYVGTCGGAAVAGNNLELVLGASEPHSYPLPGFKLFGRLEFEVHSEAQKNPSPLRPSIRINHGTAVLLENGNVAAFSAKTKRIPTQAICQAKEDVTKVHALIGHTAPSASLVLQSPSSSQQASLQASHSAGTYSDMHICANLALPPAALQQTPDPATLPLPRLERSLPSFCAQVAPRPPLAFTHPPGLEPAAALPPTPLGPPLGFPPGLEPATPLPPTRSGHLRHLRPSAHAPPPPPPPAIGLNQSTPPPPPPQPAHDAPPFLPEEAEDIRRSHAQNAAVQYLHDEAREVLKRMIDTISESGNDIIAIWPETNVWPNWKTYVARLCERDVTEPGIVKVTAEAIAGTSDPNPPRFGAPRVDFVLYLLDGRFVRIHPGTTRRSSANPVYGRSVAVAESSAHSTQQPTAHVGVPGDAAMPTSASSSHTQATSAFTLRDAQLVPQHDKWGRQMMWIALEEEDLKQCPIDITDRSRLMWPLWFSNLGRHTSSVIGSGIVRVELIENGPRKATFRCQRTDNTIVNVILRSNNDKLQLTYAESN